MISRTVQGRADESCGGYFNVGKDVEVNPVTSNSLSAKNECVKIYKKKVFVAIGQ